VVASNATLAVTEGQTTGMTGNETSTTLETEAQNTTG
jgi:hypothetical protein